ncbi:hypothetical protein [Pseudonocardia lacus]|uniref:hypothetical protein n=1 Tax=Pseudonocardia lacus TaxID=2835865 RepID=UPI001BDC6FEF|nr:hypothetical protein [Pseudonocardia lacus]
MSGPTVVSPSHQADLGRVIDALDAATRALTEATRVLTGIRAEMGSNGRVEAPPAPEPAAVISTWEDDPFSEGVPTPTPTAPAPIEQAVTTPSTNAALAWQITGVRPEVGRHEPGTAEFRYWTAQESIAGAVGHFVDLMPRGTRWSTVRSPLRVDLAAGDDLNATYTRRFGLRFFHHDVAGTRIATAESPDIVRHEIGHALLDALRPELFEATSAEADAFHEAFGDMTAMLVALRLPSYRRRVLTETGGSLRSNSRLSRMGEQLGWGIRRSHPDTVDGDCLRNAANRFAYAPPEGLPADAPMGELSQQPHSFARVFTGAFLDALAAMVAVAGGPAEQTLDAVARDMAQLLVDGVLTAPITPTYYSQVAAALVQAAAARGDGRYQPALRGAFVRRGILALAAARDLDTAEVPTLQPVEAAAAAAPDEGAARVLGYGAAPSDGYRADGAAVPGLPTRSVDAEFLDRPVTCHVAAEPERFHVAPRTVGPAGPTTDAVESARQYLATLIQLGRIDPGPVASMARGPVTRSGRERYTHRLEESDDGRLELRRVRFQCVPWV